MKSGLIELEKILNQEIEAYSKLEQYIVDKKESLVKGDIEKLKNVDLEIEKFNSIIQDLETKRTETVCENLTLNEIIEKIEKNDKAENLSKLRIRLKNIIENIQRQNNINAQLISHSLKLLEFSVTSIANALIPEVSAYNNMGKIKSSNNKPGVSSVIHEA